MRSRRLFALHDVLGVLLEGLALIGTEPQFKLTLKIECGPL